MRSKQGFLPGDQLRVEVVSGQLVFDPVLPADLHPADDAICRGVAVWHHATAAAEAACADRVFLGTNDARLIALDLATSKPCADFGTNGEVVLPPDVPPAACRQWRPVRVLAPLRGAVAMFASRRSAHVIGVRRPRPCVR
jgi:hypothetical protein